MPIPSEGLPQWNENETNIIDPPPTYKTDGWGLTEKPPSQYFNWFMNLVYKWVDWIEERRLVNEQDISDNAGAIEDIEDLFTAGVFTPTISVSTSGSVSLASSVGTYRKIGDVVTATVQMDVSSVSSPVGFVTIGGFPFVAAERSEAVINVKGHSAYSTGSDVMARIDDGSAIVTITMQTNPGGFNDTLGSYITSSTNIYINISYIAV